MQRFLQQSVKRTVKNSTTSSSLFKQIPVSLNVTNKRTFFTPSSFDPTVSVFTNIKNRVSTQTNALDKVLLSALLPVAHCSNEVPTLDVIKPAEMDIAAKVAAYTPPEHWSKAGFILDKPISLIQYINEVGGLPLWASLITFGFITRIFTAPILTKQQFAAIRMALIQPEVQKLTAAMRASPPGSLAFNEVKSKMTELYARHDISPVKTVGYMLLTFPVTVMCFLSVRNMALDPAYHGAFLTGGFPGFMDLAGDAGFGFAAVATLTNFIMLEMNFIGMKPEDIPPVQRYVRYAMRGAVCVTFPFFANFPLAVMVFLLANNVFHICLNILLRTDFFRRYCNMPTCQEVLEIKRKNALLEKAAVNPASIPLDAPKSAYVLPHKPASASNTAAVVNHAEKASGQTGRKKRFSNSKN